MTAPITMTNPQPIAYSPHCGRKWDDLTAAERAEQIQWYAADAAKTPKSQIARKRAIVLIGRSPQPHRTYAVWRAVKSMDRRARHYTDRTAGRAKTKYRGNRDRLTFGAYAAAARIENEARRAAAARIESAAGIPRESDGRAMTIGYGGYFLIYWLADSPMADRSIDLCLCGDCVNDRTVKGDSVIVAVESAADYEDSQMCDHCGRELVQDDSPTPAAD